MEKIHQLLGEILKSEKFGSFEVVNVADAQNIVVRFVGDDKSVIPKKPTKKNHRIKGFSTPTVCGFGIKNEKYPCTYIDEKGVKKNRREYQIWQGMIARCYNKNSFAKHPTYEGCTIDESFRHYADFYEWCNSQIGFKEKFELDKDLLMKGNRLYSKDLCLFLPKEINVALTRRQKHRGICVIGVTFEKASDRFVARMGLRGKVKTLGHFKTEIEAFNAYKSAKEQYLRDLAEKWKSQIDPRAYQALLNYQVEITD